MNKKDFRGYRKIACGIIFIDTVTNSILLAHPTGAGAKRWDIPKGGFDEDKDPTFLDGAIRECREETGFDCDKHLNREDFIELGLIPFKPGSLRKAIKLFYIYVDAQEVFKDHVFHCDSMVHVEGKEDFPEMDDWAWVDINFAYQFLANYLLEGLVKIQRAKDNSRFFE